MLLRFDQEVPTLGSVQDQALAWFARLQDNKSGAADQAEFACWLAADPTHQTAYDKVVQLWQSPALNVALSQYASIPLRPPAQRKSTIRRWAAAASITLVSSWFLASTDWLQRWQADITTATGEQRRVILADGSALVLNTDSAVKLDYAGPQRGVTLLSGEAYFEVQADKDRPFIVTTKQGTVRVVGTRFSVKTGDTTQVNVESGLVICSAEQGQNRQLSVGQHTEIDTHSVAEISTIDTGKTFAWLKGRLIFQDQTLADVISELDRYHPGAIAIADAKLGQTRITGNYKLEDTTALIRTLADIAGAKTINISPYLTVLKN
ncbi:FecR family protein [Methylomonas fluvii]|uniref:FecR family protein n=1 Tax=Methylomonas fluvii TaxID=1854564 RepID=A0ABR9DJV1_9GAMM|nr:FecR family protein [Methylomonas fluvii]MBD9363116.1 FecR family protein [Methylomonas fluvii]CAD6876358.1 Iron siderophore sensor protein [Methylomonas fluvii]